MKTKTLHILNSIAIILFFGSLSIGYLDSIAWIFRPALLHWAIKDFLIGIVLLIWPFFMIWSFKKTNVDNEYYRKSAIWNIWALISIIPTAYLWVTLSNLLNENVGVVAIIPIGLVITSLVFFIKGYSKNKI